MDCVGEFGGPARYKPRGLQNEVVHAMCDRDSHILVLIAARHRPVASFGRAAGEFCRSERKLRANAGAVLSNSLNMTTDWMAHDQLHVRGGHHVSWAID